MVPLFELLRQPKSEWLQQEIHLKEAQCLASEKK